MAWRLKAAAFGKGKGGANRRAMRRLVRSGSPVGVIAYEVGAPVAWCSVSPREAFVRLAASRVLSSPDDRPVWSVSCLFVAKGRRGTGISSQVLKLASEHYAKKGVEILEGYPVIPYSATMPAAFAWTGILSAYLKAGFVREKGRSKSRPIVRRYLSS
jgi:GNAT superfamily N-acetyltransferase